MNERYGTPGELQEVLEGLEHYVREDIEKARNQLTSGSENAVRYNAVRLDAMHDVLDYLGVSNS